MTAESPFGPRTGLDLVRTLSITAERATLAVSGPLETVTETDAIAPVDAVAPADVIVALAQWVENREKKPKKDTGGRTP